MLHEEIRNGNSDTSKMESWMNEIKKKERENETITNITKRLQIEIGQNRCNHFDRSVVFGVFYSFISFHIQLFCMCPCVCFFLHFNLIFQQIVRSFFFILCAIHSIQWPIGWHWWLEVGLIFFYVLATACYLFSTLAEKTNYIIFFFRFRISNEIVV